MSLYAVSCFNTVFSHAAALSPSLAFDPDSLENLIQTADIRKDTVLYMDMGEKELGWNNTAQSFRHFTGLFLEKGVRLTARIVPNGRHCEASWEKQIPFFLPVLLYNLEK